MKIFYQLLIKYGMMMLAVSVMLSTVYVKAATNDLSGDWEGTLTISEETVLKVVVHMKTADGKQVGTLDTPDQGGFDIPMTTVEFDSENMIFEIEKLSIHYEGKFNKNTGQIEGNFFQGQMLKLNFSRVEKNAVAAKNEIDSNDILGSWYGLIEIPGQPLAFVIHVKNEDGKITATADSPDQNSSGMPIDSINLSKDSVNFKMSKLGVNYEGTLSEDKKTIDGTFSQGGANFKLVLTPNKLKKK